MFTVYMHISPSNKRYIGITSTSVEHRWGNGGKNYRGQPYFWRAIQKYGWDNFEHVVLAENLTKEDACSAEIALIAQYQSNNPDYGYNASAGGECTFAGVERNPEWRHKISVALKGNKNGVHVHSKEERDKVRSAMIGNKHGANRNITKEYRRKAQLSQPHRKVIEQYTLDGVLVATFNSINEAQRLTGIYNIAEASRPNGRMKTSKGYIWVRRSVDTADKSE